jgi:hypothetical protein
MMRMILAKVLFVLGMNYAAVKHTCPKQLLPMFFQGHSYYACDDGRKTTILAIDNDKVVAIMDIKWFSIVMDQDSLPARECKYGH